MFKKLKKLFTKKPPKRYFKIFNKHDKHRGFQYMVGWNTDTIKLNKSKSKECGPGGLYFTDVRYITDYLTYGCYIREVIPKGKIVKLYNKYRAHELYLYPKRSLYMIDTWKWLIEECGIDLIDGLASYYMTEARKGYLPTYDNTLVSRELLEYIKKERDKQFEQRRQHEYIKRPKV